MKFKIDPQLLAAFIIWLIKLGYTQKIMPDGNRTFKNKKMNPQYVFISTELSGNSACRQLYKEFVKHINS